MCVIAICEERELTEFEIRRKWIVNDDGAGIAWFSPSGENQYIKGLMTPQDFEREYKDIPFPHIVHFRSATSGGISKALTHPFVCDRGATIKLEGITKHPLLFHNGVLSNWENYLISACIASGQKIPKGEWSDSRTVAFLVYYLGKRTLSLVSGKFVLMSNRNVTYWGDFQKEDGIIFSSGYTYYTKNSAYKDYFNALGVPGLEAINDELGFY